MLFSSWFWRPHHAICVRSPRSICEATCGFSVPKFSISAGLQSDQTCAECPELVALEIVASSISAVLPRPAKEDTENCCLQHVLLCLGVFNCRADAEDECGEAGEMQNSCGSRFLLFTPFTSYLLPSS